MRVLAVCAAVLVAAVTFVPLVVLSAGRASPFTPALPPADQQAYQHAAGLCPGLPWEVLAGIGEVESDHGRSALPGVRVGANSAGAEGPMQFLPTTFAAFGTDEGEGGTGDGDTPSPYDLADAAGAAARLLCAAGAVAPGGLRKAIWAYNHSDVYVDDVLGWASRYGVPAPGIAAAEWALTQVGRPYAWGATGPDAFDCSGLVLRAWEAAGVTIPRVAADQYRAGRHIAVADAQVGDLVFFSPDPRDPGAVDHVGLVVGPGLMVDAPHTGAQVRVTPLYDGLMPDAVRPA